MIVRKGNFLAGNSNRMILSEVGRKGLSKGINLESLCNPIVEANDKEELYFPQH